MTLQYATGALPAKHDYRTVPRSAVAFGAAQSSTPSKYVTKELDRIVDVLNQKARGACTGHGVGHGSAYLKLKESGKRLRFSGRFPYVRGRVLSGMKPEDPEGAYMLDVMKAWTRGGVATELVCPNNPLEAAAIYGDPRRLTAAMYADARPYAIRSFAAVNWWDREELKKALVHDGFVLVSSYVGETWNEPERGVPIPAPKTLAGGHLFLIYGYEETGDGLILNILNSWGDRWCDRGRALLRYEDYYQGFFYEMYSVVDLPDDWLALLKDLPSEQTFRYRFEKKLAYGERGADVRALQVALAIEGDFKFAPGDPDTYGPKTRDAVRRFQERYQLADPDTLKDINGMYLGPATLRTLTSIYNV